MVSEFISDDLRVNRTVNLTAFIRALKLCRCISRLLCNVAERSKFKTNLALTFAVIIYVRYH